MAGDINSLNLLVYKVTVPFFVPGVNTMKEKPETRKGAMVDSILGQKRGPALARPSTTASSWHCPR